jgi:hypothetical protein
MRKILPVDKIPTALHYLEGLTVAGVPRVTRAAEMIGKGRDKAMSPTKERSVWEVIVSEFRHVLLLLLLR